MTHCGWISPSVCRRIGPTRDSWISQQRISGFIVIDRALRNQRLGSITRIDAVNRLRDRQPAKMNARAGIVETITGREKICVRVPQRIGGRGALSIVVLPGVGWIVVLIERSDAGLRINRSLFANLTVLESGDGFDDARINWWLGGSCSRV